MGSRITALKLINDFDRALLLTGTNEGVIRIWKGMESQFSLGLVTAWRALPDVAVNGIPVNVNSKVVVDWQQELGRVLVSGEVGYVKVWDAEKELCVQDIPTECDSGVTCLASEQNCMVFVAGCADGSVRVFDQRLHSKYSHTTTFTEHKKWVVDVAMPKARPNTVVSGSVTGEIKFWNLGMGHTGQAETTINCNNTMTALAVHDFAPILASASQNQKIRVHSFTGEELGMIRYHDGFLGQRIGPVSCLAFHPYVHPRYRLLLAAGATDSIISIYAGETSRNSKSDW